MSADDWIKVRKELWTDPRVMQAVGKLGVPRQFVVGCLFRLWSIADSHSTDGSLPGWSAELLDAELGLEGFADTLVGIGWLEATDDGLSIPRFEEHNGASAKRRAQDARRKAARRRPSAPCPQDVRDLSAGCPPPKRTECGAEREREEIKNPSSPAPPPEVGAPAESSGREEGGGASSRLTRWGLNAGSASEAAIAVLAFAASSSREPEPVLDRLLQHAETHPSPRGWLASVVRNGNLRAALEDLYAPGRAPDQAADTGPRRPDEQLRQARIQRALQERAAADCPDCGGLGHSSSREGAPAGTKVVQVEDLGGGKARTRWACLCTGVDANTAQLAPAGGSGSDSTAGTPDDETPSDRSTERLTGRAAG